MQGFMMTIEAGGISYIEPLSNSPSLDWLQSKVGGNIEAVPYWDTIADDKGTHKCVVFCNEEGKLNQLPFNDVATHFWHRYQSQPVSDFLVGNIVIIWGDDELMESL